MLKLKVQDFNPQPSVVFLHGWGVNNGVFEGLLPELQNDYAIRFIDLPGFGNNHHIDISELPFEQFCRLIADYIPDGATLVGWSLGGLVAQRIAQMQAIEKMILICTTPYFMEQVSEDGSAEDPQPNNSKNKDWFGIKSNVLENFQSQLSGDFRKTLERFLAIQSLGSDTAKKDLKQIRDRVFQYEQPQAKALKRGLEYLQTVDLREHQPDKYCQTLRLFGSQDSLVPKKAIERIKALDPEARYHVFHGASHAPFISHRESFISVITDFM